MLRPGQFPLNTGIPSLEDASWPGMQEVLPHGVLAFRDFQVWPKSRLLLQSGEVVPVGSRAFDLLVVLLEGRGSVIPKAELLKRVWPSTTVDECNLRFQIATLRNVLGADRDLIISVPGRGYFFACDPESEAPPASAPATSDFWGELSGPLGKPHGLDDGLRNRLRAGVIGTGGRDDHVVDLFMRFAQQLVEAYGSIETAKEVLSSAHG